MKKGRPGVLLHALCRPEERETMLRCLFLHTTTLGVRESLCGRYALERDFSTAQSAYGEVRVKRSRGFGVTREKPEYEDLARLAREHGVSLRDVKDSMK